MLLDKPELNNDHPTQQELTAMAENDSPTGYPLSCTPTSTQKPIGAVNYRMTSIPYSDCDSTQPSSSSSEQIPLVPALSGTSTPAHSTSLPEGKYDAVSAETIHTLRLQLEEAELCRFQYEQQLLVTLADSEAQECQRVNFIEHAKNEMRIQSEDLRKAKTSELMIRKDLEDLKLKYGTDLAEAHRKAEQAVGDEMLHKVRRLQARIAEAAQGLGMTVSWPLPDSNAVMTEDFAGMESWLGQITYAIQEIAQEHRDLKIRMVRISEERRRLHNQVMDMKGAVRVICRSRPLLRPELQHGWPCVTECDSTKGAVHVLVGRVGGQLGSDQAKAEVRRNKFYFDGVYGPEASQETVFAEMQPMVTSAVDGFNACIFAYGQTRSGKTHTMQGTGSQPGVIPRALDDLFQRADDERATRHVTVSISMLEIYNDAVYELLDNTSDGDPATARSEDSSRASTASRESRDGKLMIRSDASGAHAVGLEERVVHDVDDAIATLAEGTERRRTASTEANTESSRSHCLVCVKVRTESKAQGTTTESKLWLVDLAGSERISKSNATGDRLQEAKHINKSLSALADCIGALCHRAQHVPFRNSKLTHLLQDSLSGGSKVCMLVAVNPTEHDAPETLCSLHFASRVRGLELGPAQKNMISMVDLKQLRGQVSSAQAEATEARSETAMLRHQLTQVCEQDKVGQAARQFECEALSLAVAKLTRELEEETKLRESAVEAAATAAKSFNELQTQLTKALANLRGVEQDLASDRADVKRQKIVIVTLRQQVSALEKSKQEASEQASLCQARDYQEAQNSISQHASAYKRAQADKAALKQRCSKLRCQIAELQAHMSMKQESSNQNEIQEVLMEKEAMQEELEALRAASLDQEAMQNELEALRVAQIDQEELQDELAMLRASQINEENLQHELEALQFDNEEMLNELAALRAEQVDKEIMQHEFVNLKASLEASQQAAQPTSGIEAASILQAEQQEMQAELTHLRSALADNTVMQDELVSLRATIQTLRTKELSHPSLSTTSVDANPSHPIPQVPHTPPQSHTSHLSSRSPIDSPSTAYSNDENSIDDTVPQHLYSHRPCSVLTLKERQQILQDCQDSIIKRTIHTTAPKPSQSEPSLHHAFFGDTSKPLCIRTTNLTSNPYNKLRDSVEQTMPLPPFPVERVSDKTRPVPLQECSRDGSMMTDSSSEYRRSSPNKSGCIFNVMSALDTSGTTDATKLDTSKISSEGASEVLVEEQGYMGGKVPSVLMTPDTKPHGGRQFEAEESDMVTPVNSSAWAARELEGDMPANSVETLLASVYKTPSAMIRGTQRQQRQSSILFQPAAGFARPLDGLQEDTHRPNPNRVLSFVESPAEPSPIELANQTKTQDTARYRKNSKSMVPTHISPRKLPQRLPHDTHVSTSRNVSTTSMSVINGQLSQCVTPYDRSTSTSGHLSDDALPALTIPHNHAIPDHHSHRSPNGTLISEQDSLDARQPVPISPLIREVKCTNANGRAPTRVHASSKPLLSMSNYTTPPQPDELRRPAARTAHLPHLAHIVAPTPSWDARAQRISPPVKTAAQRMRAFLANSITPRPHESPKHEDSERIHTADLVPRLDLTGISVPLDEQGQSTHSSGKTSASKLSMRLSKFRNPFSRRKQKDQGPSKLSCEHNAVVPTRPFHVAMPAFGGADRGNPVQADDSLDGSAGESMLSERRSDFMLDANQPVPAVSAARQEYLARFQKYQRARDDPSVMTPSRFSKTPIKIVGPKGGPLRVDRPIMKTPKRRTFISRN